MGHHHLSEEDIGSFKKFTEETGIEIFLIEERRQAAIVGCATDTLVFCREATAKDPATGAYRVPDLLKKLGNEKKQKDGYSAVLLLDNFLKTAQVSTFVNQHEEKEEKRTIIHSHREENAEQKTLTFHETLHNFRNRHTRKLLLFDRDDDLTPFKPKDVAFYLHLKTLKYANLIEILFYLNQIKQIVPLSDIDKKDFIKNAKKYLKAQGNVIKEDMTGFNRKGLHDFANEFLQKIMIENEHKNKAESPQNRPK